MVSLIRVFFCAEHRIPLVLPNKLEHGALHLYKVLISSVFLVLIEKKTRVNYKYNYISPIMGFIPFTAKLASLAQSSEK